MKGWLPGDVLDDLGRRWLEVQLEPQRPPGWLKNDEGEILLSGSRESLARKVRADVAAVSAALQAEHPTAPVAAGGVPSLSAGSIETVLRGASASAPRAGRTRRSHYLYWLLCRLEARGLLTFTLPARERKLPPRGLGFDALSPHLPLPTRFVSWQRHLASRALDVRPLKGRVEPSPREREYLTLAVLFAFGGPCGRGARATAARIETGDVDLAAGTVWLRDSAGERILNLTLHPVQVLSLHLYLRSARAAAEGHAPQAGAAAFPSMGTKARQRTFGRWLGRELAAADSAAGHVSAHAAPAGLKALLAGAHRWVLEIYPVYLASLLAGRFSAAVVDGRRAGGGRRRRRGEEDPENVPPSADELRLRSELRRSAVEEIEFYSPINRFVAQHLGRIWSEVIRPLAEAPPPLARSPAARSWNLFLLARAFVRVLAEGEARRYRTAERWLYTGYALLDELGGRPGWSMPEGECAQLLAGFARRDGRLLGSILREMALAAEEYGLTPPAALSAPAEHGANARSDALNGGSHRRARHAPSGEQLDRMARLLLDDAWRPRRKNAVAPLDVLLYLDLLAVGARKSEAVRVEPYDVVALDGSAEGADLVIKGVKTPAAFRLVPLDLHPNRASAERIVAAALAVEEKKPRRLSLLEAVSGHRYNKRSRSSRHWNPTYYSFSSLEHALRKLGERVGIEDLSPHDLRRASITACLLAGVPPELIAKWHGHEDLPTTFEHYVFGLSAVQARDLGLFLSREETQLWVAITDAVKLLGVTKVAAYKRYNLKNPGVRVIDSSDGPGFVLERPGRPRYVNANDLAHHIRRIASGSHSQLSRNRRFQ